MLGDGPGGVMDFRLDPELERFRQEVRAFFREEMTPERTRGHADPLDLTGYDEEFERALVRRCGERGYLGICVPIRYGGADRPPRFKAIYDFEAAYADAPAIDTAITLVGAPMLEYGSDEQKSFFVPRMIRGEGLMCIGYTEPEAGSDLGRIRTTARREGEGFVLEGVKSLITAAHKSEHACIVARTDAEAPPRKGMSMFLVPLDLPGIRIVRRATANGWTLGELHFEEVHLPRDALLGEWNRGWRQMASALLTEQPGMAHLGWATRNLERLVELCRDGRRILSSPSVTRQRVAQLHCDLDVGMRFAMRALDQQERGGLDPAASSMTKVYATELLQRIAQVATELLGPFGSLREGSPWAPLEGHFAYDVIERIHPTVSIGANEIRRSSIAQMGLGLPRS
jgi:alkylation response protein AidB-like acyl-CoA dehydrogenase